METEILAMGLSSRRKLQKWRTMKMRKQRKKLGIQTRAVTTNLLKRKPRNKVLMAIMSFSIMMAARSQRMNGITVSTTSVTV
jgi:hypothetical protein